MATGEHLVRAAQVDDVRAHGRLLVQADGRAIVLFAHGDHIYAVDNRCPHMGFPFHRGTLKDGILTCHWHHARFDLTTGGTFDLWADDVRTFPVELRDGEVWLDLAPREDLRAHHRKRLREGLEHNIPLVIGKAVLYLHEAGEDPTGPFRIGLEFGTRYRKAGWGQSLTILTAMMNLLPSLELDDRPRALYHGLSSVAWECEGAPARFQVGPLPGTPTDLIALKRWFRQFIEVRDADGAERCIVSAIRAGADHRQMSELLFAAATDHRYINTGHALDFTNKALEALDAAGWQYAETVLTSLAAGYAEAERMEESNEWRHPIDLVEILETAFEQIPPALETGRSLRGRWAGRAALVDNVMGEDPQAIADALLDALRRGASESELAGAVAYAAALRIARFHTSNEFTDWDTALHTFTFANAVQQGFRRSPSAELLRGVFDAAMSVYLDRFLNIPPAKLPVPEGTVDDPEAFPADLLAVLDRQQQVNEAGALVARYLPDGDGGHLLAALGKTLLREDRNFHTIQCVEAAFRQFADLRGTPEGAHVLIAAARYLAAHAPTVRAQGQTYQFAVRLSRGEHLYEDAERVLATVLFTDVVGSTERACELGDRRWRDLLSSYHDLVRQEVARHRGRVIDFAGDGSLATFDGTGRAIRCAQAVLDAARRIGLTLRAGIHTGEVEISGDRVAGIAVHVGARVAAEAQPGEVLVTGIARDMVSGSGIRFEERGMHAMKGIPGEWQLFAVAR
jgi:class 3 adenylate cyclase/nitrite reductase/ring-hydroxylating ferredoxin subunit